MNSLAARLSNMFLLYPLLAFSIAACGDIMEGDEGPGTSSAGKSSHRAGENCIGCHGSLKYAGTVYTDATGSAAAQGETVVITQNDGTVIEIVSDRSGNFYTKSGNPAGGYNATVKGNTAGMIMSNTNGACSASGCHDGSATPRVYKN